jgi:hypothetical protein
MRYLAALCLIGLLYSGYRYEQRRNAEMARQQRNDVYKSCMDRELAHYHKWMAEHHKLEGPALEDEYMQQANIGCGQLAFGRK